MTSFLYSYNIPVWRGMLIMASTPQVNVNKGLKLEPSSNFVYFNKSHF